MKDKLESTRAIGRNAESTAAMHLNLHGYEVLEKNWQAGHLEIDLIAKKNEVLHFIEVKKRKSDFFGDPAKSVTRIKQQNIIRAASIYIKKKEIESEINFDIIAICGTEITHIINAFYPRLR